MKYSEMTKEEKSNQKIINRVISESFISNSFFNGCISACSKDQCKIIERMFTEIASREFENGYIKVNKFAYLNDFVVPFKFKDYEKYANEKIVKIFNSLKNNENIEYYIEKAIEFQSLIVESYQEYLMNVDMDIELNALLLSNYYSECEISDKLKILFSSLKSGMYLEYCG